ncbi:MAG: hypothetical protein ACYS3N_20290 [Planctomycetota bacterium]|jgi:predicted RNA-binding Zn-ribbon protein involved in translation (DUF1610 family)
MNAVKIGIIIVCLVLAIAIVFWTWGGSDSSLDDISDKEMTWAKCLNKSCNAEYEMSLKEYFKFMKNANPNPMAPPTALTCETCGEPSVYRAEKCQNTACGNVFRMNSVPNDHADRCPKCMQSAIEESRKARKKEMAGG